MPDVHRSEASVKSAISTASTSSPQKSSSETKNTAAVCPAADDVPASPPPPKKLQPMTWAMSLASAYARIFSALESGRDVLAMPPIGQLRLDCYRQLVKQLPGITLIISSYKERMEKEIDILEKDGIPAVMLHSGLSDYATAVQLERIRRHHFRTLYISPGLLESPTIRSFLVCYTTISLIVIDEAQICSIHAPHFQPLYHSIPLLLKDLERHAAYSRPPVLALTLSAKRQVEQDIGHFFSLQHPLLVRPAFERPNLFLSVHRPQRKDAFLLDFLRRHEAEAGIIYCTEHRLTEHIAQLLNRSGFPALSYHAGLTRKERMASIRAFCAGARSADDPKAAVQVTGSCRDARMMDARVFCAGTQPDRSSAGPVTHDAEAHAYARILVVTPDPFLELDRSDVRFVLHYTMPESLEHYYRELAHAGCDGLPAECILLANEHDFERQRTKLEKVALGYQAYPEAVAQMKRQFEAMRRYVTTHQCLRSFLRDYFGGADGTSVTSQPDNASISAPSDLPPQTATGSFAMGHVSIEAPSDPSVRTAENHSKRISLNEKKQASTSENSVDYEVITLPSRNRVLRSAELPADESLRTIRQSGRYPENRVQKVSMQLKRAEKQHTFIRYADQAHMKNQAYKYEHLRTDPWELCEPGIRVQRFRAFSIPRDSCCVNCDPEHFLEEDRYGISDTMGLQERMREHLHQLETDMDVGRKIRLWKAGEKPYHFDYDAHAKCTGRIMAMRKVEYQKTADAMAATLGQSTESSIKTPARASTASRRPSDGRLPDATACEDHASAQTIESRPEAQQLRLLESARLEISPEMRTQLLGNLKALRKRLAMERSVQAYQIFTDKSLVEMCRMLPLTREEFARIYGVGQRKLELHCEAFTDEIRKALDPARVADFYESVTEEMQEDTYASSSDPVLSTTVIKPIPGEGSECQKNTKYRFIPDDVLLAFLEEKYLQQRTRKQVKKKQDFFLTVAEAASFRCADDLRSPEIAALLNALVAEAEETSSTNSRIASIEVGASDSESTSASVVMANPVELTSRPKLCARERKKLSGATIDRKLAGLGYLELSEFSITGRPRQAYLPTTKGEAAGIALGTRKSQGGVDYPTAYFSAAAASWVATLFVRDETE